MFTLRHTTVGRTPLDEWSARRRELYLATCNTHTRQISVPPARFEPTIQEASGRRPTSLDRASTGIGAVTFTVWSTRTSHHYAPTTATWQTHTQAFPWKMGRNSCKSISYLLFQFVTCPSLWSVYIHRTFFFFKRGGMSSNASMVFEIPCGDQSWMKWVFLLNHDLKFWENCRSIVFRSEHAAM